MTLAHALPVILVAGALTYALRLLPFLVVDQMRGQERIERLGRLLPGGIMIILIAYTVVEPSTRLDHRALLGASVVTAVLHVWRRNPLISIGGGVLVYACTEALW